MLHPSSDRPLSTGVDSLSKQSEPDPAIALLVNIYLGKVRGATVEKFEQMGATEELRLLRTSGLVYLNKQDQAVLTSLGKTVAANEFAQNSARIR